MNKYSTEIKWAIIFLIAGLIWMFVEKSMGLHGEKIDQHAAATWIFAIPAFLIYYFALREKRQTSYNGRMTWAQGFKAGMIMTAIVAVVSPLSQYITHTFITPDFLSNLLERGVETGKGSEEDLAKMINLKTYMMISPIMSLVMGAITTAIVALVAKKA